MYHYTLKVYAIRTPYTIITQGVLITWRKNITLYNYILYKRGSCMPAYKMNAGMQHPRLQWFPFGIPQRSILRIAPAIMTFFFIVMQDNGKADGIHREIYQENGCKPTLVGNHGLCYICSQRANKPKYKLVCAVYIIMIQHNNLR